MVRHAGTARDRSRRDTRGGLGRTDHGATVASAGSRTTQRGRSTWRSPRSRRGWSGGGGPGDEPATRVEFLVVAAPAGTRVLVTESVPRFPARVCWPRRSRRRSLDVVIPGPVFAALADPTRRWMVETLLHEGSASAPELTSALPITRQAVAKHLATLSDAGLIERAPGGGREVNYRLPGTCPGARHGLAAADGGCAGTSACPASSGRWNAGQGAPVELRPRSRSRFSAPAVRSSSPRPRSQLRPMDSGLGRARLAA